MSLAASTKKPGGRRSTRSPWLIQTVRSAPPGSPAKSAVLPHHLELRAAVLALGRRLDHAPELVREELQPVADAEHRHAELEHARVELGAPCSNTLEGPPERITPAGRKRSAAAASRVPGWISQ